MLPKLFSFTHFRKNAPANPLESHTFKTKDLKPFRFTHLQKKGGGPLSHQPPLPPLPPRVKADGPPPIFGISSRPSAWLHPMRERRNSRRSNAEPSVAELSFHGTRSHSSSKPHSCR